VDGGAYLMMYRTEGLIHARAAMAGMAAAVVIVMVITAAGVWLRYLDRFAYVTHSTDELSANRHHRGLSFNPQKGNHHDIIGPTRRAQAAARTKSKGPAPTCCRTP
jgi:hypothetical protein